MSNRKKSKKKEKKTENVYDKSCSICKNPGWIGNDFSKDKDFSMLDRLFHTYKGNFCRKCIDEVEKFI